MGLVSGQARVLMLTSRKIDLEAVIQNLVQQSMNMSAAVLPFANRMSANGNQMSTGGGQNPAVQQESEFIRQRTEAIQAWDKNITMIKTQYENQHKMIETELESAKKIVDKAVESGFKYFA